jgi:hypothetical protein
MMMLHLLENIDIIKKISNKKTYEIYMFKVLTS